jgi:ABC-type methionine transport system ATPase subunit
MAIRQVTFSFPEELLGEPVIYTIGQQFRVTTNILLADVSEIKGWVKLELEGEEADIDEAIAWAISKGVWVDTIETPS